MDQRRSNGCLWAATTLGAGSTLVGVLAVLLWWPSPHAGDDGFGGLGAGLREAFDLAWFGLGALLVLPSALAIVRRRSRGRRDRDA